MKNSTTRLAAALLGLLMIGCAHQGTAKKDPLDTQGRWENKMASGLKNMREEYSSNSKLTGKKGKTSSFDKQFNTASAGDRGGMKSLGAKGFHTKDVAGLKSFSGTKDYKTTAFSQSGKTSHYQNEKSRYASQTNRMGGQTFATKKSQFDGKMANQSGKTFHGANDVYKTGEFQQAKKSLEDNKRVVMEPGSRETERTANAYSEDQVKHMLGR